MNQWSLVRIVMSYQQSSIQMEKEVLQLLMVILNQVLHKLLKDRDKTKLPEDKLDQIMIDSSTFIKKL